MTTKKRPQSFHEFKIEWLQDPANSQAYLEVILEEYAHDHDVKALIDSLESIAEAMGGTLGLNKLIAKDHGGFDKALAKNPNLEWGAVLEALGFVLVADPV